MTDRTLSARALNRALLARQLLLERSHLAIPDALEQVAGLQTQYAPSGYIGLWSRLAGFRRAALTAALEDRSAIQATLMRITIHMTPARDYWPLTIATRRARREWWLRVQRTGLDDERMEAAAAIVRGFLAEGPRRQKEILAELIAAGYPRETWIGVGQWVDMVRVPPSGTWERPRADLYGLADDWLDRSDVTEDDGLELLLRRYLAGFGPASLNDAANWAGVPVTMLRAALDRVDVVRYRDEQGRDLLDLPRAPLPDEATRAPVRFLGTWDANLLVHARRTLLLPEAYRPRIFGTKTPHSFPTFLVDGAVAGTWRHEEGRVEVLPFDRLSTSVRRAVHEEAERLAVELYAG